MRCEWVPRLWWVIFSDANIHKSFELNSHLDFFPADMATSCFPGSLWNGAMCIESNPYMKNWFAMQLPLFECTKSLEMYWVIFKFLPFEPEIIQLKPICWSFFWNTPFSSYFGSIYYAQTFFFCYFCMRTKLYYEWKSLSNQLNQAKVSKNFFVSFLISHEETTNSANYFWTFAHVRISFASVQAYVAQVL